MRETWRVALSTLRLNPLRTLLSTLGVVIGVASLVAILALSDGMEAFTRGEIERTTDLHMVNVAPVTTEVVGDVVLRRDRYVVFTVDDERALAEHHAGVAEVGLATTYASFWRPSASDSTTQLVVTALTPAFFGLSGVELTAGRAIAVSDVTAAAPVAVVSAGIARRLAGDDASAIGTELLIGDRLHRVIGVAAADDTTSIGVGRAAIPFQPTAELPGLIDARPPSLAVRVHDVERAREVRESTERWLAQRFDVDVDDAFVVSSNVERVAQAERAMLVFKLVMSAITGISLLVGGIGIMNILLASISERTREIGIRRATGARRGDILHQFLAESIAISALGSAIGLVLGLTASLAVMAVVTRLTGAPIRAVFAWQSMLLAVVAALIVGLVFGMYPARRAAALSPIEALRHE
ncbi:MAG TPA: ABC transporter permease [Longimicrobiales bacterium]